MAGQVIGFDACGSGRKWVLNYSMKADFCDELPLKNLVLPKIEIHVENSLSDFLTKYEIVQLWPSW